jgi:hypothetical protein
MMVAVESLIHLRAETEAARYMSACGLGYTWPSSMGLRDVDKLDEVTCVVCQKTNWYRTQVEGKGEGRWLTS